jgi:hypothetical protein
MPLIVFARRNDPDHSYDTALVSMLTGAGYTVDQYTGTLSGVDWAGVRMLIIGAQATNSVAHVDDSLLDGYNVDIISLCRYTSRVSLSMSTGAGSEFVSGFTRLEENDPRAIFESVTSQSQLSHRLNSLVNSTLIYRNNNNAAYAGVAERMRDGYSRVFFGYHRFDVASDDMKSLFQQFLLGDRQASINAIEADDSLTVRVQHIPPGGFMVESDVLEQDDAASFAATFYPILDLYFRSTEENDSAAFLAQNDWYDLAQIGTAQLLYRCEIIAEGFDPLPVPISSWQGTQQTGRSSYLQAVVPAAADLYAPISQRAGGEFVVYQVARFSSGVVNELEMARSPLQTISFERGSSRSTVTISGYRMLDPAAPGERTLRDLRSISVNNGIRVRCAIDWLLRPGMTAVMDGQPFEVAYINYYVQRVDSYMDVGERPL